MYQTEASDKYQRTRIAGKIGIWETELYPYRNSSVCIHTGSCPALQSRILPQRLQPYDNNASNHLFRMESKRDNINGFSAKIR